jgi:hypothetical protein
VVPLERKVVVMVAPVKTLSAKAVVAVVAVAVLPVVQAVVQVRLSAQQCLEHQVVVAPVLQASHLQAPVRPPQVVAQELVA